jgi:hypothetical protein
MEILRVPPYNLSVTIEVTNPVTEYSYKITDMADLSTSSGTVTSNSSANVTISLPSKYDGLYTVSVDGEDHLVDVVRPYVDPTTKGSTASEVAQFAANEQLARAIIDSVILDGFYYKKKVVELTGLGADYLPIWQNSYKLLRLHENNVLVFDADTPEDFAVHYELTEDRFAIKEKYAGTFNRNEAAPNILPATPSDIIDMKYGFRGFAKGFDYKAVLEVGYKRIPQDIVRATQLLIDDIACGKLDYYKRYITDYNTDQFKLKFDSAVFNGTGNLLVDKILSKYMISIRNIGVL